MSCQQHSQQLIEENAAFAGSGGVSGNNRHARFLPAFQNVLSGEVELSRFCDGRQAPCHLFDALPEEWVLLWDLQGRVCELKAHIVSGFVRQQQFYSRQQAAEWVQAQVETAVK